MPIYEYRCHSCRRKVALLVRQAPVQPTCPRCGSERLSRLISGFAVIRSEESRLETLAEPETWGDLDTGDPRSLARLAKRLEQEAGEDLEPEFHEMVDRLESGELPEEGETGEGSEALDEAAD